MHNHMPPSKNWVARFISGDFSTRIAPRLGRIKTVITPEIIEQIQELIANNCRISAKSITEKLEISRDGVGSIIMKIWSCEKSPRICFPNV
jgi:predicted HTH transcriptional regulator